MSLATFIRADTPEIIAEWESFAAKLVSSNQDSSPLTLRNHIVQILDFVVTDIESPQTDAEEIEKSHGEKSKVPEHSAAETHAALRQAGGFNLDQMVSEYRALRASVVRLWHAGMGEPTRVDIEDLIRLNEALDQALTESIAYYSKSLEGSRNLVLGVLSHDLLNPLASAQMSAQLIPELGDLNERQTMLTSQIVDSTERATSIIHSLIDLTKARLGSGLLIIKGHMDVAFVGRQLVDEMRVIHPDRTFKLDISDETQGEWDKARIGQVLSNLLGNAVRYGFSETPIVVTIMGLSDDVTISVHNEGVPIPPDVMGKVFNAFTRGGAQESKKAKGSTNLGLGLYIVKEIIAAHGGTIDVSSSDIGGTTFTAHLPRSQPDELPIPTLIQSGLSSSLTVN